MHSTKKIRFSEVPTFFNEDILDDINFLLYRLKNVGLNQVIIVDLTNPDIGIPVVRAIVPGLETFKITKSVMGMRARSCFKQWTSQ
jgi:ribosomal protein S12 methylthiotransferase accessory factor